MGRNYEVWTSLESLQPDGISIFQPPNEIRPESNGGKREGGVHLFQGGPSVVKKNSAGSAQMDAANICVFRFTPFCCICSLTA